MPLTRGMSARAPCPASTTISRTSVIGLFIWARIDDQRQRSFVTGYPGPPARLSESRRHRGRMRAGRRQPAATGGQTSHLYRLSRSVINSVGPAGAEFARIADSARLLSVLLARMGERRSAGYLRVLSRTFASRLLPQDLAFLAMRGARPAGPPPATTAIQRRGHVQMNGSRYPVGSRAGRGYSHHA